MEAAKMMYILFHRVLQKGSLEVFHEPAKRTSGLSKHLQDGFVAHYLIGSHEMTLAIITPNQTPRRPREMLKTTYKAAMKNVPVRKSEKISHSNVEKVLYAPTKPTGIRNLQAGFISVRLPRKAREKPMITQAVMLITNVPYGNLVPMRPATNVPTPYLATEPSEPPMAIQRYFCKFSLSLFMHAHP
jgi:hypothetical protein